MKIPVSKQAGCLQPSGNDMEMQSKLPCMFHLFLLVSSKTPPQRQLTDKSNDLIVQFTVISRDLCSCLEGFCRSDEKEDLIIIELLLVSYGKVITAPKHGVRSQFSLQSAPLTVPSKKCSLGILGITLKKNCFHHTKQHFSLFWFIYFKFQIIA